MPITSLKIDTMNTQGEGIGRLEGKAVFVSFTLPDEEWDVEIIESHKKYDRAIPLRKIEQDQPINPYRTTPPCPYYGECGGCQLQHISNDYQHHLKQTWLSETFRRIAHLTVNPNPTLFTNEWEYRNKVYIPIIKKNGDFSLAFHKIYAPHEFVPVSDCLIAHPYIRQIMPPLSEVLARLNPKHTAMEHSNQAKVLIRVIDNQLYLRFEHITFHPEDVTLFESFHQNHADHIGFIELMVSMNSTIHRVYVHDANNDSQRVNIDAFRQVNNEMSEILYNYILNLPFESHGSLLDGYCGTATLTRKLANIFTKTIGVESDSKAVRYAIDLIKKEPPKHTVQIENQPMEQFIKQTQKNFDAIVLNPPRAGLSKHVRSAIPHFNAKDIIMISCHPAALARDTAAFVDQGYSIASLQPFDMFPQTYHLEAVIHLKRQ